MKKELMMSNAAMSFSTASTSLFEGEYNYNDSGIKSKEQWTEGQINTLSQSTDVSETCNDKNISMTFEHSKQSIDVKEIRESNRAIQSQVSDEDYQSLLKERNELVVKEFRQGLTKKEKTRLAMLRWEIESIEDARLGPHLDKLEKLAVRQQGLAKEVNSFVDEIKRHYKNKSNKKNIKGRR